MLNYTLRQLEYFAAAASLGSIVRAAEHLNVSQPSVSTAISKLEDQLGVQLFLRQHAHGVALTSSGRRLFREARDMLRQAEDFYDSARSVDSALTGNLALGCFLTLGPLFMPALVTLFTQANPGATISLKEANQDDLISGLSSGRFDLALLYDLEVPSSIRTTPLARFAPYVLLSEDHPMAKEERVDLHELAGEPFVLLDVPPSRNYFLGLFHQAGLEPNVTFSSPSIEMVRGLVGRGIGYSMLVTRPKGDITYDGLRIVTRPLTQNFTNSTISLARPGSMRPTRLMDAFENFCQTWFEDNQALA